MQEAESKFCSSGQTALHRADMAKIPLPPPQSILYPGKGLGNSSPSVLEEEAGDGDLLRFKALLT